MKAMINIANQMQSTITNDNRLVIKLMQPLDLVVNETYYVYIFGELIESQSKCMDIEKQNEESGFTLGWEFKAGEKRGNSSVGQNLYILSIRHNNLARAV